MISCLSLSSLLMALQKKSWEKKCFLNLKTPFLVAAFLALTLGSSVAGEAIHVVAELSRTHLAAGDMAELHIQVTGAQQAEVPREIKVAGLQIQHAGQSSQVQMVNFSVTSSVIYSYIVIPLQAGNFTIPPISLRVEGKVFKTDPLQLTVAGMAAPTTAARQAQGPILPPSASISQAPTTNAKLAFGEFLPPKNKLYVGEVVPVDVRFYIDERCQPTLLGSPHLGGEGFLLESVGQPVESSVERNGVTYNVLTLHTLLSGVKPGIIEIPPASLKVGVVIPGSRPAGMPDLFAQLLGQAAGMSQQELTITSHKASLEILPLPQEGRPEGFSGAIGAFEMNVTASPKKYAVGDPVSLTISLEGSGNLKSIERPTLLETAGWRTYPPATQVTIPDPLGLHGTKTFETTMMATQALTSTPGVLFSYFNPTTAKYVTLSTKPLPLEVTAGTTAAASPTPRATGENNTAPVPLTVEEPLSASTLRLHSWETPLYRPLFLLTSGVLLAVLFLLVGFLGLRQYQTRASFQKQQVLQKIWLELQDKNLDPLLFYSKAAAYAELLIQEDPSREVSLEKIFLRHNQIHYGAREGRLSPEERHQFLKLLHP